MTSVIKLDLGNGRGGVWVEAEEIEQERSREHERATRGGDVIVPLAASLEQFRKVFEIAQAELSLMKAIADETVLEISAKLSTNGNLIIVQGSAEGSIKVTMKWTKPNLTNTRQEA